ncbi:MAG TPA: cytochrome P450 [Actinophytocola sp.]|uniref:cytochrome P450 n=1 Tax=Actinophytocola sp. TaxID=1872138 RepID=UPI002DC0358E|nr:cytochrome P450 [Actinophytocola sp.]HEU5473086.1 cytochrome P450 [Actinophytocola sp.]
MAPESTTTPSPGVAGLPLARPAGCPFDPPAELARIRERHPLVRMTYPDGHEGWLVTGHALARAALADQRVSSRYELTHYPMPGLEGIELPPAPVGDLTGIDPPGHTRYRKLLNARFTNRRMRLLTERVQQVTAEYLDAMDRNGPEVDLVAVYAHPIPAVMICELLGVPYADRESFQGYTATTASVDAAPEERGAAHEALQEYVRQLVLAKRAAPTDDLLSDLTSSDLTDEELTGLGSILLAAGLITTANMLALGAFALLRNPAQLAALRADPAIADRVVEELMRYLSIAHTVVRAALADIELDGHLIKAGETLTISLHAANRDPERFADPDTLDLNRDPTGHMAFGHGIHQCLGQQLARVEMRVGFPALFTRFPTLRLAVPPEDVPLYPTHQGIYGVHRLPVTWDQG